MSSRHLHSSLVMLSMLGLSSALSLSNPVLAEESLGVIQVESSTIDDRFADKRSEASSIAVIDGEEVDNKHAENIQKVLQAIPGITTEVQSGDSLKIHIRGIENQRYMGEKPGVAVVIDGVPVFERTGRVNIDLDNIESIKVIKGGASYLFGEDALSGAVIITTKRGAKYKGYKLAAERGSFGYHKELARAGFSVDQANGHVQVSKRGTDGYHDDSASKADYVNGKLQYYLDDVSDLTFGFESSDREKNSHGKVEGVTAAEIDPESTRVDLYNDYANHYKVDLAKYFLTYSRDIGASNNLMLNAYSFTDDTDFLTKPTRNDPRVYTYANDYAQAQNGVKAEFRAGGESVAWMLAADLRDNSYDNNVVYDIDVADNPYIPGDQSHSAGEVVSDDETGEEVKAVYGEFKKRISAPLTMTFNARIDKIEYDYNDTLNLIQVDKTFDVKSYRLGANYATSKTMDVYGNISTGFRAPTIEQLFAGDIDPTGDTESNPDLEPEEAINMEVGLRTKTTLMGMPAEVDMAVFQINRDDFIMATAGQYASTDGSIKNQFDNIGGMRSRGLELAVSSMPSDKVYWSLAYTYLDSKFTKYDNYNLTLGNTYRPYNPDCSDPAFDPSAEYCIEQYDNTGNTVPRTPKHHYNFSVSFEPAAYWTITGEIDSTSSYYADELNWIEIGGRRTFNVLVNYDRSFGATNWSFFARVDNLFDRFYYNTSRGNSDSNSDGVFDEEDISITVNPGRTYTAGLSVAF